jgi:aspartyl-tRNA(Asn)/glutamyl-tRNA(Gln) amidotransferase subunit C
MANIVSPLDVAHVAELANLSVSSQEQQQFANAFSATLDEIDRLQDVDTQGIEPTHQVTGLVNVWREDEVDQSRILSQAAALSQVEKSHAGLVLVDRIIDEE